MRFCFATAINHGILGLSSAQLPLNFPLSSRCLHAIGNVFIAENPILLYFVNLCLQSASDGLGVYQPFQIAFESGAFLSKECAKCRFNPLFSRLQLFGQHKYTPDHECRMTRSRYASNALAREDFVHTPHLLSTSREKRPLNSAPHIRMPRSKLCQPTAYCTATGTDVETVAALDPLPLVPLTVNV